MLRSRFLHHLLLALLLGTSAGCTPEPGATGGPAPVGPAGDEGPAGNYGTNDVVAVFPSKIPILKSTEQAAIAVTIDGNATTRKVNEGALCIEGYYKEQFGKSSGLPQSTAVPSFRWVAPPPDGSDTTGALPRSWPHKEQRVVLPLDGRSHLVAWVDIDGNGVLSIGDRVSPPTEPLESAPEGAVEFRINHVFGPTLLVEDDSPGLRNLNAPPQR